MHCQDCPRYDPEAQSCRDEKLNPLRWDQAVDIANIFGLRAICMFNDHRERLVDTRRVVPLSRQARKTPPSS